VAIAPSGPQGAAARQDAGATRVTWTVAFTLGGGAVLGSAIAAALGPGRSWPGVVLGLAAAALLVVTLVVLRRRDGALGDDMAELERSAAQWQRYAEDLQRRADQRQAHYNETSSALAEAFDRLVRLQLPAALNGTAVPPPLPESTADGHAEVTALCNRVVSAAAEGSTRLREQFDTQIESNRLAVVTLARRVQASAHRIQEQATRMANRHPGDSDVLESSMLVDHAAAQQARHAQSVAVLCGEWPGQQWPQPLSLLDVVRAAAGRIVAYRRIAVSGEPDVAAAASAVEPLIHLIAELLANATQSSPPTTQVLVTVRAVQRGAVIEMDDGGVGLEEHQLDQVRQVVSGRRLLGLGDLGEVPQTGMAVVGQYVRRHGFRVDLMPSPYGGVRAIVLVPAEMVENLEPAPLPAPAPAARPTPPPPLPAPTSGPESASASLGSLPQRRSRRDEAEVGQGASPSDEPPLPPQTPQQAGSWMAAYFSGSVDGPGTSAAPLEGPRPPWGQGAAFPDDAAPSGTDPFGSSTDNPGNDQPQPNQTER
jgi:signal transduction histidine kinase